MGINGLLPVLKSVTQHHVHVSTYAGKKVAIDAYGWLHRGAHQDPRGVAHKMDAAFAMVVDYCVGRCLELRREGVAAVMVFDGARLPMKEDEETKRRKSRMENMERAKQMEEQGNVAAARMCWGRSMDICPVLAAQLICELRRHQVEFVVAPYEADAQMAFLARTGYVHAVITEDSDLVAYQCPRILYKVDRNNYGQEITYDRLRECREIDLSDFSPQMVLEMCIFSGCDYLNAIAGIGIKRAHGYMKKFRAFSKVCRYLRLDGYTIPQGYEERFQNAIWTFKHQRIFDIVGDRLDHVEPLDYAAGLPEDINFLGPVVEPEHARAIAQGRMHPITRQPFPDDIANAGSAAHVRAAHASVPAAAARQTQLRMNAGTEAGVRDGKENIKRGRSDRVKDTSMATARVQGALGRPVDAIRSRGNGINTTASTTLRAAFQTATRGGGGGADRSRRASQLESEKAGTNGNGEKGRATNEPAKRAKIYDFFTVLPEKIPDAVMQPFKLPRRHDSHESNLVSADAPVAVRAATTKGGRQTDDDVRLRRGSAAPASFTSLATNVADYSDRAKEAFEKMTDSAVGNRKKRTDGKEGDGALGLDRFKYEPPSKPFSANM